MILELVYRASKKLAKQKNIRYPSKEQVRLVLEAKLIVDEVMLQNGVKDDNTTGSGQSGNK